MTREEAIARLKILTDYEYDEDLEALNMAIEAFEKVSKIEEILSRECTDISKFAFIRELFEQGE